VKNFSGAFPVWVKIWVKTRLGKMNHLKKFKKQRKPAVFIGKRRVIGPSEIIGLKKSSKINGF